MLTVKEIVDTLTYDGNVEVDGYEAQRIIIRLMDLQLQKLQQADVSGSLQSSYSRLENAFRNLQQLYIQECRNNPNHVLNEKSFIDDWNASAGRNDR